MQKSVKLEDLAKYVMISHPQISPDAEKICFTVTKIQLEENAYNTNLWLVDRTDSEMVQLTSGNKDTYPEWAPDSSRIAFISKRTLKKEEPGDELWIINVRGGEAQLVLKRRGGISNVRWSPDGQKILFLSAVPSQQEKENVKVVRGLPLYFDAKGFVYNLRSHLFIVDIASNDVKQLTKEALDVLYAEFSNNGDRIAYVAENEALRRFGMLITSLFVLPRQGGVSEKITTPNMRIGALTWSPDDNHIAFKGSSLKRGYTSHENIYIISTDGQELRNLTNSLDRTVQPSVYCDVTGPFIPVQGPVWDANYIYFLVSDRGRVNIYRVSHPDEKIENVVPGDICVSTFSVSKEIIVFSRTTPKEPTEIWIKERNNIRRLTMFNEWIQELQLVEPECFEFMASDGINVEGWIMKPLGLEQGKKYPVILQIHGGPKSTYGYGYLHEFQFLATKGYAVIYTNPRGSGGYSEEFADIRGHYGEREYKDLMEALDYVLSKYSYLDPQRLGVTGISYGGFMTNWIVGHTDRFQAAVTQASISNWISFFGTSDIGFSFTTDQIGADLNADPWSIEEKYLTKSPLRYAKNVKTPTMIMNWVEDHRCPFEQGLQFYTALQYFGVESELVILSGSSHAIFIVGKPKIKLEKIKHLVRWFDKFLKE